MIQLIIEITHSTYCLAGRIHLITGATPLPAGKTWWYAITCASVKGINGAVYPTTEAIPNVIRSNAKRNAKRMYIVPNNIQINCGNYTFHFFPCIWQMEDRIIMGQNNAIQKRFVIYLFFLSSLVCLTWSLFNCRMSFSVSTGNIPSLHLWHLLRFSELKNIWIARLEFENNWEMHWLVHIRILNFLLMFKIKLSLLSIEHQHKSLTYDDSLSPNQVLP